MSSDLLNMNSLSKNKLNQFTSETFANSVSNQNLINRICALFESLSIKLIAYSAHKIYFLGIAMAYALNDRKTTQKALQAQKLKPKTFQRARHNSLSLRIL